MSILAHHSFIHPSITAFIHLTSPHISLFIHSVSQQVIQSVNQLVSQLVSQPVSLYSASPSELLIGTLIEMQMPSPFKVHTESHIIHIVQTQWLKVLPVPTNTSADPEAFTPLQRLGSHKNIQHHYNTIIKKTLQIHIKK